MTQTTAASSADGLHENQLVWQDLVRAREWGLGAAFIEEKASSSSLAVLCSRIVEEGFVSAEAFEIAQWCVESGASIKSLEQIRSAAFFELTRASGAARVWRLLIDSGYSINSVCARFKDSGFRSTTKLGLLCSAPYCLAPDLPALIAILVDKGVDPNERDSEGISPLGRLNDQLKNQERQGGGANEGVIALLTRGAEALLEAGALAESILPSPVFFAAGALKTRLMAAMERRSLASEIQVQETRAELDAQISKSTPRI